MSKARQARRGRAWKSFAAGETALPHDGPQEGRLRSFLFSEYDADIFGLAIPALFSILLDPLMTLTDSGKLLDQTTEVCTCD